jgi:hypothetical protein
MEKIMSKTNETSKPPLVDHRPLADGELDAVSGGTLLISNVLKDLHDMRSSIINNSKG